MPKINLRHAHAKHVDKKLRFRLRIYILISLILIGIFVHNIWQGTLRWDLGLLGLGAGITIGIVTSRMFHVSWNHDAKKVVSQMDIFGIFILIMYIAFEISRDRAVDYVTHGFQVGTIGFAILAGIMFGRVIGTSGQILKVMREQNVLG